MADDLGTIGDVEVTLPNENDGGASETIVVDTQVVNGEVIADHSSVEQQASVNSRNQ